MSIVENKRNQGYGTRILQILKEDKKAAEIPVFIPTIDTCSYVCSSANLQQCGFNASSLPSNVTWKNIDAK